MNRCRIFAAAAAVLLFAGQAFAMSGGQFGGSRSMGASMSRVNAGSMQHAPSFGTGSKQGTMAGSKQGTMAGSKQGTMAGGKQGTMAGSKQGTMAGSKGTKQGNGTAQPAA